jgi:type IV secretory pathway VirB10-like protein
MTQANQLPQVQEKAPKPAGLLPKNVQSWLLISLALGMVIIMWFTGGKKPPVPAKTISSSAFAQAPLEVNETKIAELQNRIQELQRQQLLAQSALAQQTHFLAATEQDPPQGQQSNGGGAPAEQKPEDQIAAERKRRTYLSLFGSNVALTYRKAPGTALLSESQAVWPDSNPLPSAPGSAQMAQLLKDMQTNRIPGMGVPLPTPARNGSAETTKEGKEEGRNPAAASAGVANAAAGKTYVLFEGTTLETVLINRLDGSFAGPVECLLSTDVYSNDRQHLLVPVGSKLLGETKKVEALGQTRLAIVFHRILMPDGYSVSLDQFEGLNQIGDTGLRDQVNNHYLRIFGVSLAVGALGAVSEAGTGGALNATSGDLMRQGFAASTAQSASQILDKFLNILPTVTIREGHRVKVYLSGDLALPDYINHQMPSDL